MKAFVGFAGFGGVDIALIEAGYQTIGVEIDPDIAAVNIFNGGDVIYELYHFSPLCPPRPAKPPRSNLSFTGWQRSARCWRLVLTI
ncbi:MAG: hypothetical protein ACYTEQ_29265 [Planctomycetota bacterium]|jgi:hypothetical protein